MKEESKKRKKDDDEYQNCKYKKSDFSQLATQPKSNKSSINLSHFPMSERQQYALLKQMEDDSSTSYFPKETTENLFNSVCHTSEGLSYSISTTVSTSSLLSNLIGSDKKLHKRNGAGETMLIQMAKKGDLNSIKTLIAEGANVNEQDYAGWTALHECSIRNYPHITSYLLQHGADVNCCGLQGDTALHDAVKNNCSEVVKLLLKYGADLFKRNDKGFRPIDLSTTEEIKKLIHDALNSSKEKKFKYRESSNSSLEANMRSEYNSDQQSRHPIHIEQPKNYKSLNIMSSETFSSDDQSGATYVSNIDKSETKESTKDPYAFEDEEMNEKSSFSLSPHKISPNKSNRHKNLGNGSGNQNEETSNSKDTRHLSSPSQCGSHNSSPKVPPLRIRINGHSGADRQTSEDSQPPSVDEHQSSSFKVKNSTVEKHNFSDSESSLISIDICINKSSNEQKNIKPSNRDLPPNENSVQKSPELEMKEETVIKDEPKTWNSGGETLAFDDDRKSVKEENYVKEESKSSSTLGKRSNGRTLRSHTAAAQKNKDDEENVSRAPIKKRKFKSRTDSSSNEKNSTSSNCSSNAVETSTSNIQPSTSNILKGESCNKNILSLEINQDSINSISVPTNKIMMSPTKNEMWDNPYQKALILNQQINSLAFNLEVVHSKPPIGFQDFLLTTKQYLLSNRIPRLNSIKKRSVPSDLKKLELINLFQEHEEVRYNQALKHQSEREQLRINAELEVIRAQNTAARQLAGQDRPFSFFSVTAYKNFTYVPESVSKSNDHNKSQNLSNENDKSEKFSPDDFIKFLKSIKTKFDTEKKKILTRHLHESESLMMVQRMDWELKLKEMILEDIHGDSSLRRMSVEHIPMTEVPNDFMLFTTDPFQISGCILT